MIPGTQIFYVPAHANGDTKHPDCLPGFVCGAYMGRTVFVYFWREVGVSLRTTAPQATDMDRLVAADSCEQALVAALLNKQGEKTP